MALAACRLDRLRMIMDNDPASDSKVDNNDTRVVQSSSFAIERIARSSVGSELVDNLIALLEQLDDDCTVVIRGVGGRMHAHVVRLREASASPFYGGSQTVSGTGSDQDSLVVAIRKSTEAVLSQLNDLPHASELVSATGTLLDGIGDKGEFIVNLQITLG